MRIVTGVVFCWTLTMTASAIADEAARLEAYFAYFAGTWDTKDDAGVAGELTVRRGGSARCYVVQGKIGDEVLNELFGIDPASGKWTCVGYSSEGARYSYALDVPGDASAPQSGDRLLAKLTGLTVDRRKISEDVEFVINSDDEFEIAVTNSRTGDERLPDRNRTYRRRR